MAVSFAISVEPLSHFKRGALMMEHIKYKIVSGALLCWTELCACFFCKDMKVMCCYLHGLYMSEFVLFQVLYSRTSIY